MLKNSPHSNQVSEELTCINSIKTMISLYLSNHRYWNIPLKLWLSRVLCCLISSHHVTRKRNPMVSNPSVQFSSVAQLCPTLCDPMNHSTPVLPVHHQLPEFTHTHVHQVSDAIQPSHPLSSPSPPASNPSQQQGLFQWVNSSHEVTKVLEFQL